MVSTIAFPALIGEIAIMLWPLINGAKDPYHRIVDTCHPKLFLLLLGCRVKELANGSIEQVGLIDKGHVPALGQNH